MVGRDRPAAFIVHKLHIYDTNSHVCTFCT